MYISDLLNGKILSVLNIKTFHQVPTSHAAIITGKFSRNCFYSSKLINKKTGVVFASVPFCCTGNLKFFTNPNKSNRDATRFTQILRALLSPVMCYAKSLRPGHFNDPTSFRSPLYDESLDRASITYALFSVHRQRPISEK